MSDRPLTVDEARRMFEAMDSAALERQARAEKAEQTRYRVCIEPSWESPHGSDGKSLPESEAQYAHNTILRPDGSPLPYAEYLTYYGNPDRHVMRDVTLERRCEACGHWEATDFSTSAIDFMDDDQDADRTGTYSLAEVRTWEGSYLREVVENLLLEQAK